MKLSKRDVELVHEYLDEVEAIIDADDGTLMPLPFIDKHLVIKEILEHEAE